MRQRGFNAVPLGVDGPDAWERAHELNEQWNRVRCREASPAGFNYPSHTLGNIFARYWRTNACKGTALTTQFEW